VTRRLISLSEFVSVCYRLSLSLFPCFFFQAEDGIRDLTVTGVQTCALPIYVLTRVANALALVRLGLAQLADVGGDLADQLLVDRSEERRVGKECRAWYS